MIIGIDASQASREKKTGINYLANELILNLQKIDKKNHYLLFSDRPLPKKFNNANAKVIVIPFKKFWHKLRLPLALLKYRPNFFLEIGYMLPAFAPRSVCLIHDLASKHFPEAYTPIQKYLLEQTFKKALGSYAIIFISKNSQSDFAKFYPKFQGKSYVVYPGYDKKLFKKISKQKDILHLKSRYILYLGRLEKRKNVKNLIKAYEILRRKRDFSIKLVLAGNKGFGFAEIQREINSLDAKIKSDIIMSGYIPEKNLPHLYAGADLFVFPSFYEGFGIPILEAMACRIPVVCSKNSSMPEAAGSSVQYFDPYVPEDIAKKISNVLTNQKLRQKMIAESQKQIKKFSYEKMATSVLKVINSNFKIQNSK